MVTVVSVSFSCSQVLTNCSATELNEDLAAKKLLVDWMTNTTQGNTSEGSVELTGVTDVFERRRLKVSSEEAQPRGHEKQRILSVATGASVSYAVILQVIAGQGTDMTDEEIANVANLAYNEFTRNLRSKISSGEFINKISGSGMTMFSGISTSVDSLSVSNFTMQVSAAEVLSPTVAPTPSVASSDSNQGSDVALVAGVVIGAVFVVLILFAALYKYRQNVTKVDDSEVKMKPKSKAKQIHKHKIAVVPSSDEPNDERFLNIAQYHSEKKENEDRDSILSRSSALPQNDGMNDLGDQISSYHLNCASNDDDSMIVYDEGNQQSTEDNYLQPTTPQVLAADFNEKKHF